jgi:hypothetical protein
MDNVEPDVAADATPAQEMARELDELRTLTARFRRLAPVAQPPVLRALLGKRETLLRSIGARVSRANLLAKDAGAAPETPGARNAAFAQTLREVADMDRESQAAFRKRTDAAADELLKLRAGKKWRQSNSPWT